MGNFNILAPPTFNMVISIKFNDILAHKFPSLIFKQLESKNSKDTFKPFYLWHSHQQLEQHSFGIRVRLRLSDLFWHPTTYSTK